MFQQLLAEHLDSSATLAAYASIRPLGDWKLDISVDYVGHDFFFGGDDEITVSCRHSYLLETLE